MVKVIGTLDPSFCSFGTNPENDIFIDVSAREGFEASFERESESVFVQPIA